MIARKTSPHDRNTDPRTAYDRALTWANDLISRVEPTDLDRPTPCSEYEVRALLGHLVATVDRARGSARAAIRGRCPRLVTGVPDDGWAAAFAAAVDKMTPVWADDALLDRPSRCRGARSPAGRRCGATSTRRWCTAGTLPSPPVRTPRPTRTWPRLRWPARGEDPRGPPGRAHPVRRGGGARAGRGPDRAAGELVGPPPPVRVHEPA